MAVGSRRSIAARRAEQGGKSMRGRVCAAGAALPGAAPAATAGPGPLDVAGELNGAPYRILVPENWNGKLLVHAHGYRDKADHLGEIDDRSAPAVPTAALAAPLLAQGYALAGSAYRSNGWAVEEGIHDTKALVSHFRDLVGKPSRTLLWGFSMGSLVTFALAEQTAGHFDGYLAACAVGAGATRAWDGAGVTSAAYAAAFGWPASWGTTADVRDDVDFEAEVAPKMFGELVNPVN